MIGLCVIIGCGQWAKFPVPVYHHPLQPRFAPISTFALLYWFSHFSASSLQCGGYGVNSTWFNLYRHVPNFLKRDAFSVQYVKTEIVQTYTAFLENTHNLTDTSATRSRNQWPDKLRPDGQVRYLLTDLTFVPRTFLSYGTSAANFNDQLLEVNWVLKPSRFKAWVKRVNWLLIQPQKPKCRSLSPTCFWLAVKRKPANGKGWDIFRTDWIYSTKVPRPLYTWYL